jgi:hypothetical protein
MFRSSNTVINNKYNCQQNIFHWHSKQILIHFSNITYFQFFQKMNCYWCSHINNEEINKNIMAKSYGLQNSGFWEGAELMRGILFNFYCYRLRICKSLSHAFRYFQQVKIHTSCWKCTKISHLKKVYKLYDIINWGSFWIFQNIPMN